MSTGKIRILCIDDEARILRALKALFREHEVYVTSEPQLAIRMAKEHDIDVIVCDQRMPQMLGVEVLREIKILHPRAMRILLTGYSDLNAVLASVNEGEVFRFINKPWNNEELRQVVVQAAQISRDAPVAAFAPITEKEKDEARKTAGVLVIEDDPETQNRLREILGGHYQVRFAATAERALQVLEQHETGVVISEAETAAGDWTQLLKLLKKYHPEIPAVVITDRANAQVAIDLINEGQVYRMLLKPVRMGTCRLSVESAIGHYWQLKQNPQALKRYSVVESKASATPSWLSNTILNRIKMIPSRLLGMGRIFVGES
jgi:DNA-binding NtrC family response regulator